MATKDFKASQIRTSTIIVSGSASDKPALLTQQHLAATPTSQNGTPAAWTLVVLSNARRGRKITPEAFKARIDYNDKLKN